MPIYSQVTYTGNGSTTQYSISFNFIDSSHVKAFLNGVETTAFTISSSTLTFNSAPANGVTIRIERQTPIDARLIDFTDGSVLTEADLDRSADQNFFVAQEITDDQTNNLQLDTDDKFNANNKVIKNLANPTNAQDAVTKFYLENTWLSPTDKTNLTTVAGISSNVTTVAGNTTNVNTVAGNNSNITTVATNIANINTVATDIAKVITVANDLNETVSEIETVAQDLQEAQPEIDTVAGAIANVNTVGGAIANVNTVASSISNVNATAGAITNINTVASNLSGVNSFAERYRVGSLDPTSSNDAGDLFFNTTSNILKFYNGTAWADIDTGIQTETDPTAIPFSLALG